MKNYFLTSIAILLSLSLCAQHRFIVQNGTAQVYNDITQAFENAVYGDTIYLPGGEFTLSAEQQIQNKKLTIYGAGYNPDSTQATYHTYINHGMTFKGNCDGSYITGIHFNGNIQLGDVSDDAMDIVIERCRFNTITLRVMNTDSVDTNFDVNECVLDFIAGNNAKNASIQNCIVLGRVYSVHQSVISHNYFTNRFDDDNSYESVFRYLDQCLIVDNVFSNSIGNTLLCWDVTSSVFSYNMFAVTLSFPIGTNLGNDNIFGVTLDLIYTDASNPDSFDYAYNWHLITGSPGVGAASDGTDIGIYGGAKAWKDGGLPYNPHIRTAIVPQQTTDGTLPVEIHVGAQNN